MSGFNLSKSGKITRVNNAAAAGTSDINTSSVDMSGYDSVQFIVAFGAITAGAVTSCKLQTSSDDSTWNNLENTGVTVADDDDNKVVAMDLHQPLERYIRVQVDRGTANAVVDGVFAIQYNSGQNPVTQDATTVIDAELNQSPAEGTP